MRSLLLLPVLLASAGCLIVPPRVGYPATVVQPRPGAPAERLLSEREAIDIARSHAASRGLRVDRVTHAHLDGDARWHVELRGGGNDRAKLMIDARSGRVLKANFKDGKGKRGRDDYDD